MNVFVLDSDPAVAAGQLCTQHSGKMLLESVQLLCAAAPLGPTPYRRTHVNHPCARWLREVPGAWGWLVAHARELASLFEARQGKPHASARVLEEVANLSDCAHTTPARFALAMPEDIRTARFALAMPEDIRTAGGRVLTHAGPALSVELYRAYYCWKDSEWAKLGRPMRWHGDAPVWMRGGEEKVLKAA